MSGPAELPPVPLPVPSAAPVAPAVPSPTPLPALTPEEQMERFAAELKGKDWGHQPC